MTSASLFAGVGGLDLAVNQAFGCNTAWMCESDPACRTVLAQRFPGVTVYPDVHEIDGTAPRVDILHGGYPCQPFSIAGKRKGADQSGRAAVSPGSQPSFATHAVADRFRAAADTAWGVYEPAVRRWEHLTRPAPRPTDDRGRLAPGFVEWMMGLPDGWTDLEGVSRSAARLRMLGNAVVPQQAALAIGMLA